MNELDQQSRLLALIRRGDQGPVPTRPETLVECMDLSSSTDIVKDGALISLLSHVFHANRLEIDRARNFVQTEPRDAGMQ